MAQAVIVTGLTPDDKVPGRYTSLSYGVGVRSAGSSPCVLYVVGSMREAQAAESSAVTQVGGGPAITLNGTPLINGDYIVTITLGGANGTATFSVSRNGTSVATGVTVPTTPFTYLIPGGSGVTITFGNGTYVLAATYQWSSYVASTYSSFTANSIQEVFSDEDADKFGAGSELALMCRSALKVPGVTLKAIATAWPGGAAKASLSVTIGGSWTSGGNPAIRLGGKTYRTVANVGATPASVAALLADVINGDPNCFCTAAVFGATIVLTVKVAGSRGNYWSAWKDLSEAPAGLTMTLTGGTALTGGGIPFSGGTGTDDVTANLATLQPELAPLYNFQAFAANDAVNMALVETQLDALVDPMVSQYVQAVFATNGTYASAVSLAQTTLNHVFSSLILDEQGEGHPALTAAAFAAVRATTEGANPNPNYNNRVLTGVPGRSKEAQGAVANHSKLKAALNAGITPTKTSDGKLQIVRAITTKCLTGASPDYRTLDVGQVTVPMRVARESDARWDAYCELNPYAGPDPDLQNGEPAADEGVATPSGWRAQVASLLQECAKNLWIYRIDAPENAPNVYWDAGTKRIMSGIPVETRPLNHQLATNVRQVG